MEDDSDFRATSQDIASLALLLVVHLSVQDDGVSALLTPRKNGRGAVAVAVAVDAAAAVADITATAVVIG